MRIGGGRGGRECIGLVSHSFRVGLDCFD
jgi:hypothetical protein